MRNYFMMLVVASVIGSVLAMLAGGTFEKYVKYIVSLVCVIIILLPLRSILGALPGIDFEVSEISQNTSDSGKWIIDVSKERISDSISGAIFNKFGIKPYSVDIDIESTEGNIAVNKIFITLRPGDASRSEEVRIYIRDLVSVETEVSVRNPEAVSGE